MNIEDTVFVERTYRKYVAEDNRFEYFNVSYLQTDLLIAVDKGSYIQEMEIFIYEQIVNYRRIIENYIKRNKQFLKSFVPISLTSESPKIVEQMIKAGFKAGTGPMAAVAGAFSQFIGKQIIERYSVQELIIENGGDIFLKIIKPINISVFAGKSVLSQKVGIIIPPKYSPVGVCTSAGTIGHSISFGKADAVMIVCKDTLLADALATTYANCVKSKDDVDIIINKIKNNRNVISALIIKDDLIGYTGELELCFF